MDNMDKLNLLHEVRNLTDSRPLGPLTLQGEEVELALADLAVAVGDAYLPLPLPEKLTLVELKLVAKILGV